MARTNQKLSEKAKKSAITRHNWALQWCWNYERMQASGYAYAMVPVMKELYDTEEEVCQNLERHMQFYNSHPGASAVIFGASVALEENYQPELSDSIKVALMGPMASIGDTIQGVLIQPFTFIISAALANEGNLLALPVLFAPMLLLWFARWPVFWWGYRRSVKVIEDVSGSTDFNLLREAAQILGLTVIGGFVPGMVGLSLKWSYTREIDGVVETIKLQDTLNGILPYLLPIALVGFCYWLLRSRRVSPVKVILIVAIITFVLGAAGVL
jgi:PTS system mannose-specific IID component